MAIKKVGCRCGNFGCGIRITRGLKPFCEMESAGLVVRPGFASYAAAAASPGEGPVRLISGGQGTGGPKRFARVAA
jgi:hypothetical protein